MYNTLEGYAKYRKKRTREICNECTLSLKNIKKKYFTVALFVDKLYKTVKINDFRQTWQSCLNSIKWAKSKDVDFVVDNGVRDH